MAYWLLKTEPTAYSWEDLESDRSTCWDGVKNNAALKHIRAVKKGDEAFIYHTGRERRVIGTATVTSDPYPDPEQSEPRLVVFDIEIGRALKEPVGLAEMKEVDALAGWDLFRLGRLSVVPVSAKQWKTVLKMGGR